MIRKNAHGQDDAGKEHDLPWVTVAVCTRNRVHNLGRCLTAIRGLVYPRLHILLVDNAPNTDAAERVVKRDFTDVRYVTEPRPGLDWARNRAIMEAKGEIIAFTDDDVVVDPGWIDSVVRAFGEHADVMAVTGRVLPYELETEAQVAFETYGGFGKGLERKTCSSRQGKGRSSGSHLAAGDLGTGANMAFRRSVFDAIGGFDPALDMGTPTGGGGDLEIFFRVVHEGYTLVYEPDAVVRHIHRREYRELREQIESWGTAFMAYLSRSAIAYPTEAWMICCFAVRWLIGRHVIRTLRHIRGPGRIPLALMLLELWGSLKGPFAYGKARNAVIKTIFAFGPMGSCFPIPGEDIETICEP